MNDENRKWTLTRPDGSKQVIKIGDYIRVYNRASGVLGGIYDGYPVSCVTRVDTYLIKDFTELGLLEEITEDVVPKSDHELAREDTQEEINANINRKRGLYSTHYSTYVDLEQTDLDIYPSALLNAVEWRVATMLDNQYRNHIKDSERHFTISYTRDFKIIELQPGEYEYVYKDGPLYRSISDAVIAKEVLKSLANARKQKDKR